MSQPLVSVIIPNYNYARFLPQAVDSVLQQTYSRVEVIVVDDGSQDDSAAVLAAYGDRIRFFRQENSGVTVARNRGAFAAAGEYLAFLDADDYWLPTKLERQMELYRRDPELGLTHCGVEEFDNEVRQGCLPARRLDGMEGWVARELLLFERAVILGGGSGLIMPRALFEEVGGFDQRLSTSADWELFYRLALRRRVGFVAEPLVRYRIHGANMHGNLAAMERDMLLGYGKAFDDPAAKFAPLRRRCYGNLYMTLAGSSFRAGQYAKAAAHACRSFWFAPTRATHLLGMPVRWWRRTMDGQRLRSEHGQ